MADVNEVYKRLQKGHVLIIHSERQVRFALKSALRTYGGTKVAFANDHISGEDALGTRQYEYILFEARGNNPRAIQFAEAAIKASPNAILVGLFEPAYVDEFFDMLHLGVTGFLVVPCNTETLEESLTKATSGLGLPKEFRDSPDRNEAFTQLIVRQLDVFSTVAKHLGVKNGKKQAPSVRSHKSVLRDTMELATRFFKGGKKELQNSIAEACIEITRQADARNKTRLGSLRKKLAQERESQGTGIHKRSELDGPPSS